MNCNIYCQYLGLGMSVNHPLGLDMSALYEVRDPLEDVGHLPHHSQPLLHQGQQLLVLLRCGALLRQENMKGL